RSGALVGERLSLGCAELEMAHGYDHCYIISGGGDGNLTRAARIICPESGIALLCETTQPGVQLYTANWLGECPAASDGVHYRGYDGICLETQHFPDSPNHSEFPTTELRPGEVFSSRTVY
ncbi:MAG: galactose-1-epimerase, partial [Oscillospiraceae bacterium]